VSINEFIKNKKKLGEKILAVLIDPDKAQSAHLHNLLALANNVKVDLFFIGGSTVSKRDMEYVMQFITANSEIPTVIFPGHYEQLNAHADALLFLSLISGRNPDLLIGQQIKSISFLRQSNIEVLSTGYILVDGGGSSSVSQVSQTLPIPADQKQLIIDTAVAGDLLGMEMIYLEAGSGARQHVSSETITAVASEVQKPIIVGGGIRSAEVAVELAMSGADIIVIGNVLEKNPEIISEIAVALHSIKQNQTCH